MKLSEQVTVKRVVIVMLAVATLLVGIIIGTVASALAGNGAVNASVSYSLGKPTNLLGCGEANGYLDTANESAIYITGNGGIWNTQPNVLAVVELRGIPANWEINLDGTWFVGNRPIRFALSKQDPKRIGVRASNFNNPYHRDPGGNYPANITIEKVDDGTVQYEIRGYRGWHFNHVFIPRTGC